MKNKIRRIATLFCIVALLVASMSVSCFAATPGEVVVSVWNNNILPDVKQIINNVLFPVLIIIAAVVFLAAAIIALVHWKKQGTIDWTWIIVSLVALIIAAAASSFFWLLIPA